MQSCEYVGCSHEVWFVPWVFYEIIWSIAVLIGTHMISQLRQMQIWDGIKNDSPGKNQMLDSKETMYII
jgi:hypothetical protein